MTASTVIPITQANGTRADKLLHRAEERLSEESSRNGMPELARFPNLRSKYKATPNSLKQKPADTGHVVALAELVSDALMKMTREIEKLKKSLGKR